MSIQYNDRMVWPKGRLKAFTLSYDDGVSQDLRLIKLLKKYGVACTFNLNPGLFGREGRVSANKKEVSHNKFSISEVSKVYKGFEIAAHGDVHCCMRGMDTARCINEIMPSRQQLEQLLHHPVKGFAYAFGAYDDRVLEAMRACGMSYGRTIDSTHCFDIPQDFLQWHPTCHHGDKDLLSLTEQFLSDVMYFNMDSPSKLFYVWGHSYEFDQDDNWDVMEEFLQKVSGHGDVWYATNGEIYRYVEAFRRLVFTADGRYVYNPSAIPVCIRGMFSDGYLEIEPGEVATVLPEIEM